MKTLYSYETMGTPVIGVYDKTIGYDNIQLHYCFADAENLEGFDAEKVQNVKLIAKGEELRLLENFLQKEFQDKLHRRNMLCNARAKEIKELKKEIAKIKALVCDIAGRCEFFKHP